MRESPTKWVSLSSSGPGLKLLPQMVQPIASPVRLCPDVTRLSNVRSLFNKNGLFFAQIIERIDYSR